MSYKLQIVMSDEFYSQIKVLAEEKKLPVASFVRSIVAEWMEKREKEVKQDND